MTSMLADDPGFEVQRSAPSAGVAHSKVGVLVPKGASWRSIYPVSP